MKEFILPAIIALLGSGAFFSFLQFIINRHDVRKGLTAQRVERIELIVLMANYPRKVDEILAKGYHYFVVLKGDGFVKPLFADWLASQNLDEPEWFKGVK